MTQPTRRTRSQLLSLGLLVTLLAGSVIAAVTLRNLVQDQNQQLLDDQTKEAGLVVSNAIEAAQPTLDLLGATYAVDPHGPVANTLAHGYAAQAGGVIAIATA
ncbi:MAG TPA: hypothetical protein VK771_00680, partial [Acidimicrobiia bacterium]|nr:hypothetical protein [Acidimicrobiia bacterium]